MQSQTAAHLSLRHFPVQKDSKLSLRHFPVQKGSKLSLRRFPVQKGSKHGGISSHLCDERRIFYAFIIAVAILVDNARSVSISRAASEKSRAAPAPFAVSIFPSLTTLVDTTEAPVSLSSNPG